MRLVNKAISYSNKTEKTSFIVGMKSTDGMLGGLAEENHAIQVNCTKLPDIISKHMSADFSLVCDIEGAEVEMLHFEPQVFSRCRFALMELHRFMLIGKAIEVDETLRMLTCDLGFRLIDRNGPVVCLRSDSRGRKHLS